MNRLAVQAHADRWWIGMYTQLASNNPMSPAVAAWMRNAEQIDDAYTADQWLSSPVVGPFPWNNAGATLEPDPAHWSKPIVFLIDELSMSCGDMVPALVKENGLAVLFGQTTMGGGANVETVTTLVNSGIDVRLSRGLMTVYDPSGAYLDERFIEDNGVSPDVTYSPSLADFRAGFVDYVNAFNAVAAAQ